MSVLNLRLVIDDSATRADLESKRGTLMAAIEVTVGRLGKQLQEMAQAKIAPVIRTAIGQGIFDSIQLQAAAFVGAVCATQVYIDPSGDPSYIVALVREFGGEKWYDIFPLEMQLGFVSDAGIGKGIKSPFSSHDQDAWNESRLPHALAWAEGGAMMFAKHVWHPPAPEQSYLRSSLAEIEDQAFADLTAALNGVLAS
jgi:hypothetical protein